MAQQGDRGQRKSRQQQAETQRAQEEKEQRQYEQQQRAARAIKQQKAVRAEAVQAEAVRAKAAAAATDHAGFFQEFRLLERAFQFYHNLLWRFTHFNLIREQKFIDTKLVTIHRLNIYASKIQATNGASILIVQRTCAN